jgi:hypothetical protein
MIEQIFGIGAERDGTGRDESYRAQELLSYYSGLGRRFGDLI